MLPYLDRIPVCLAYEIDGERCESFRRRKARQGKAAMNIWTVLNRHFGLQKPEDLPEKAMNTSAISKAVGCPIVTFPSDREEDYIEVK